MNWGRLLLALAVALVAAPSAVDAQPAERVYRIGWLGNAPLEVQAKVRPASVVAFQAFVQGLQEHGWIERRAGPNPPFNTDADSQRVAER